MSKKRPFVARQREIGILKALYERQRPMLVVIKGRRRIGKSRLIEEFATKHRVPRLLKLAGLPPTEGVTAQTQRDHFAKQLKVNQVFEDWTDAFNYLGDQITKGDVVLLDEISWMASKDPCFVPKLKAWWDIMTTEKPHVLLVFCGSVSTWIEKNIINSTAFFGRISRTITLEPLSIPESAELLKALGFKGSAFEIYQLLSVLGGIPWYLEQVDPKLMAQENIQQLCFQKDGLLTTEFNLIFHDLFNGKGGIYKKILELLKDGMKSLSEIRQGIHFAPSGTLSQMMGHLVTCGFVQKHEQWSFKTTKPLKQKLYRICDPYVRFYLKMIEPKRTQVDPSAFGFQVENLLLQNRDLLLEAIGVKPEHCKLDGPYRQSKTLRMKGCQIDYLVQTNTKNLFLCEFKFERRELGLEIIEEVQEKSRRLSVARGFAVVPVLFHIGGVSESVYDRDYFYRVVDISNFLQ